MDWLDNILKNPLMLLVGFNVLIAVAGVVYMVINRMRVKQYVYYFSEGERLYEQIKIDATTPKSLFSIKRGMRFIRTGTAYKNRLGNTVLWLAKRGTGYLFRLEDTTIEVDVESKDKDGNILTDKEGKPIIKQEFKKVAKKLGTLWEGLESILGTDLINDFTNEVKVKLMNPEIFLTVELESGNEPYDVPKLDEEDIRTENAARMSSIIFSGVKEALKEDWIRLFGMVGVGVAACLALIRLGVL